jgi:hypothetical protein
MSYEKPVVNLIGNAATAIRDVFEKSNQVQDGDTINPDPASAAAYAADE